jgi:hypothetical protein
MTPGRIALIGFVSAVDAFVLPPTVIVMEDSR